MIPPVRSTVLPKTASRKRSLKQQKDAPPSLLPTGFHKFAGLTRSWFSDRGGSQHMVLMSTFWKPRKHIGGFRPPVGGIGWASFRAGRESYDRSYRDRELAIRMLGFFRAKKSQLLGILFGIIVQSIASALTPIWLPMALTS